MTNLRIPVYAGGYQMDADALQATIITDTALLIEAVLTEQEREAVIDRYNKEKRWCLTTCEADLAAAAEPLIHERLASRDRYGYTVAELLERVDALRTRMADQFGVVGS